MYDQVAKIEKGNGFRPDKPIITFTNEELDKITQYETGLNTFYDENIINFIEGKRDMSEWDTFVKEVKEKNLDDVMKVYNDAYNRLKAKSAN